MKGGLTIRTSGVVETTPLDGSPKTYQDTVQCVHCQRHRVYEKGAGKLWGYCLLCGGPHCATTACSRCVPAEAWMENVEAGRAEDHRRILVANPGIVKEEPCHVGDEGTVRFVHGHHDHAD